MCQVCMHKDEVLYHFGMGPMLQYHWYNKILKSVQRNVYEAKKNKVANE